MLYMEYGSPLGSILLAGDGQALTGLWLDRKIPAEGIGTAADPVLMQTRAWLDAYFAGLQPEISIPLSPQGTAFQKRVWQRLREIPYGEVCTYGDIAREIAAQSGKRMSAQAVGNAVGSNPISILIPCHRVVGAGGKLTGYAWGLERKQWLLSHEGWKG